MAITPGKKNPSNAEFESMLDQFEKLMRDLEIEYEKYFNGMEKRPPIHGRRQVQHIGRQVEQAFITNTALKFRARALAQRLTTLQTYWNRVMRQIENGTYIRDLKKARQRQQLQEAQEAARDEGPQVYELDMDLGGFSFDDLADELAATFEAIQAIPRPESAQGMQPLNARLGLEGLGGQGNQGGGGVGGSLLQERQQRQEAQKVVQESVRRGSSQQPMPPRTMPPKMPVPQQTVPPQVPGNAGHRGDEEARRVYEKYIAARRECNQSTDISFDRLHQSMESQRSSIQQKRGIQDVDFDVVIRNGQAFLKPTTKEN